MATLDTLPPDRRAIIELVLRQGRSYEDIAGMLDMPALRVRSLAREALVSLAPASARRVDDQWRGQLADYVMGQQSGPESTATRGHLKKAEPARVWVASLLDSLDELYGERERPDLPSAGDGGRPSRGRKAAAAPADEPETVAEEPAREKPVDKKPAPKKRASADGGRDLSPGAKAAVRRRRILAALVGTIAVAGAVVVGVLLLTGDDDDAQKAKAPAKANPANAQARVLGQVPLQAVGGGKGRGVAAIGERGGQRQLLVQATGLKPSNRRTAYEVWLYNSRDDAVSIGAQFTDEQGQLQGAGPLPADFAKYEFIDVSREPVDDNAKHSGESVMRAPLQRALASGGAPGQAAPDGSAPAAP